MRKTKDIEPPPIPAIVASPLEQHKIKVPIICQISGGNKKCEHPSGVIAYRGGHSDVESINLLI